jgi:hypothetical protein
VGSKVKVLYNPSLPAFGVNYENLQVLEDEADLARTTRSHILGALGLIAWTLALTTAVHVWFRWTVGKRATTAEIPSAQAGLGQALLGLGLAFLVGQVPRPAWGGVILGLLLAAPGAAILRRLMLRDKE